MKRVLVSLGKLRTVFIPVTWNELNSAVGEAPHKAMHNTNSGVKAFGVDVSEWLQSLQAIISNSDEFLKQIEVNKQDKIIAKFKSSELKA